MATILVFTSLFLIFGCKNDKLRFVQKKYTEDSLISEGYMLDTLPVGYWKSFDLQKNLVAISEFKLINNQVYLNQEIVFNKQGDTLYNKSNFFTFKVKTVDKDSLIVEIKYEGVVDAIYNDAESYPMLVYNNSINVDFSNLNKLKLDTLIFHDNKLQIRLHKNSGIRGVINEMMFLEKGMEIRKIYIDFNDEYQDISEIR
ncbi:hypothetical protein MG290_12430 [Flavobacterium sp. CBA20B-1]|uniref:hypothetical protein n=1 Tax=unclassified Flavobacterium TaxID=196869 RepID=UPI0022244E25|nr:MULTISPECIES: hypothetical protein [unclassified Flavobacterium]WCM41742.1 hypothetical protein MG290_12430 [Flavobacterium sp. CBA20B-1]